MTTDDCFELGYILRPHGLKGAVVVVLEADEPEAHAGTKELYLMTRQGLVPYKVEDFNLQKQGEQAIVKLKGLDTVEQTEGLKGVKLYLPLSTLPPLADDQFYYHEVVGFTVYDNNDDGNEVGPVTDVYELPQQVMLGVLVDGVEALIPLHDDFLVRVDKKARRIVMKLPEGLVDVFRGGVEE